MKPCIIPPIRTPLSKRRKKSRDDYGDTTEYTKLGKFLTECRDLMKLWVMILPLTSLTNLTLITFWLGLLRTFVRSYLVAISHDIIVETLDCTSPMETHEQGKKTCRVCLQANETLVDSIIALHSALNSTFWIIQS